MKAITGIIMALMMPMVLLKWVGWIGCSIWLVCLGDWAVVVGSLAVGWVGGKVLPLLYGILALPFMPLLVRSENRPVRLYVLATLMRLITGVVFVAWCTSCLICVSLFDGQTVVNTIPRLIMSYIIAIHTLWNLTNEEGQTNSGKSDDGSSNFASVMLCGLGHLSAVVLMCCGVKMSLTNFIVTLAVFYAVSIPMSLSEVYMKTNQSGY